MPSYLDDIIRNADESPLDDVRTSEESRLDQGFAERDEDAASRFGAGDAHSAAVSARLEDGEEAAEGASAGIAEGASAGALEGAPAPVEGSARHAFELAAASRAQAAASEAMDVADFDEDADDLGDEAPGEARTARRALRRARRRAGPDGRAEQTRGEDAKAAAEDAAAPRPPRAGQGAGKGAVAPPGSPGASQAAAAERAREAAHGIARAHGAVATRAAAGAQAAAGPPVSNARLSSHLRNFFRAIKAKGVAAQAGIAAKGAAARRLAVAAGAKGALGAAAPVAAALLAALALCVGIGSCSGLFGGILDETTTEYDIDLSGNELVVAEFLLGHGLDETHVAAIMANMRAESGGEVGTDFDTGSIEAGSGAGHGLCQWTGGRWNGAGGLLAFANQQGKPWTDIYVQLGFFWMEYSSPWSGSYTITSGASDSPPAGTHVRGSKSGFEGASDLHDATRQFCYGWERPGVPRESRRLAFADAYFGLLTGGEAQLRSLVVQHAREGIGTPYVLGGRYPQDGGTDCAGLVAYAYLASGLGEGTRLDRPGEIDVADVLSMPGEAIGEEEAKPGDIVLWWEGAPGVDGLHHVGIWVGGGQVIEDCSSHGWIEWGGYGKYGRSQATWYRLDVIAEAAAGGEYVDLALSIAADDSHGYALGAMGPNEFDCQGLVKHCLSQSGYDSSLWGFDSLGTGTGAAREGLKAMGFSEHAYTGHDGVPAGAVMLYHFAGTTSGHVAFYVGDGRIVEAISNYDGRPGDSSGQEIRVGPDWAAGLWQYYYTPPR